MNALPPKSNGFTYLKDLLKRNPDLHLEINIGLAEEEVAEVRRNINAINEQFIRSRPRGEMLHLRNFLTDKIRTLHDGMTPNLNVENPKIEELRLMIAIQLHNACIAEFMKIMTSCVLRIDTLLGDE